MKLLERFGVDTHIVELFPAGREATTELLHAEGLVDLIIPRGSSGLIGMYVVSNCSCNDRKLELEFVMPYFDASGDIVKAVQQLLIMRKPVG